MSKRLLALSVTPVPSVMLSPKKSIIFPSRIMMIILFFQKIRCHCHKGAVAPNVFFYVGELFLEICFENCELVVHLCGNTVTNLLVERLDVLNVLEPACIVDGEKLTDGVNGDTV